MEPRSVAIIGGGIVGLATALRLTQRGVAVTVLEKEDHWAPHQTGHNSGVIHAGPYYKPGSLKARMCVAGNRSMTEFAEEHGIPYDICGKLIVATSAKEVPQLRKLEERGIANGTPLERVTPEQAREYEPYVSCVEALHVKSTGIIDYGAVTRKYAELAAAAGATLLKGTAAIGIVEESDRVIVEHTKGTVSADAMVNCAGLQCDKIARLAGLEPDVQIVPFRGEYYELHEDKHYLVNNLIYPVPDPELPFLGVHLTRMIDGSRHAGPNAVFAFAREGYTWGTINVKETVESVTYPGFLRLARKQLLTGVKEYTRSWSRRLFARSLAQLVPSIRESDIRRAGAGIRAQALLRDGSTADDFIIQRTNRQVHVLNAPSPAATASLEIGSYVASLALGEPVPYA